MNRKYINYLKYVLIHKYHVMTECFSEGLYWQGIMHDMSKFLPSELIPYVNRFYGNDIEKKESKEDFDFAWLLHQKRNPHHWQFWILLKDECKTKIFPMPKKYIEEMICDWIGSGKAQGFKSPKDDKYFETRNWYNKNKDKMRLHAETRFVIEDKIKKHG